MPGTERRQPGWRLERPSRAPHVELEVAGKTWLRRPASRESESWVSSHWPCGLLSSSTWRQAGAQVTQGSEDRKARETLAVPHPQGKRTQGRAASSWAPTCCRKKLEEDGPGWGRGSTAAESLFADGYPRCAQTRTRQGPPPAPPDTPARSKTRTKATLPVEKDVPTRHQARLHDGSCDYFHEHLTSTYSAPATFSHALPPKLPSGLRDSSQFPV